MGQGISANIYMESGDEQVFGQATAMFVTLSTFLATELYAVAPSALLAKRLAFARTSSSRFLSRRRAWRGRLLRRRVSWIVVDGVLGNVPVSVCHQSARKQTGLRGSPDRALGHSMTSGKAAARERGRHVPDVLDGGRDSRYVRSAIIHRLSTCNAVVRV